jgi:hypothetical protein
LSFDCICQTLQIEDTLLFLNKKNSAITLAQNYLNKKFANFEISKHFFVDSAFSLVICEDYKTFFSSNTVYCLPRGFEIKFDILVSKKNNLDTISGNLFIPVDSSFNILENSLKDEYPEIFFKAWGKVIQKKYKINYEDVLKIAAKKEISDYYIQFISEKPKSKNFFWLLTSGPNQFRINPLNGHIKLKKLKKLNLATQN